MAARRPNRPAGESSPGLFDQSQAETPGREADQSMPGATQSRSPAPAVPQQPVVQPKPAGPQIQTQTLSVSDLTEELTRRLGALGTLRVEGELSGIKRAGSGHIYFSLKDRSAAISCAIWRSRVSRAVAFDLEEGMQVVAEGKLDVYAPRGTYSLIIERLEPKGIGALLAQLERLKTELKSKGWFDRARPLPLMPRKIGLVTSRDTAALRDILRTRSLRWPGYPLRLIHTVVQGATAARSIAAAIERLDASGVDVIVLARGGGSLEDLWCFNELPVAEAIRAATVPVVSGVGHETDVTLADLVADHRAHTPTDAAQTVIPDRAQLVGELERLGAFLMQTMDEQLLRREDRLGDLAARPALGDPSRLLGQRAEHLEGLLRRARFALSNNLAQQRARLADLRGGLERQSPESRIARWEQRLATGGARLSLIGPRALERREEGCARGAASLEAYSPLKVLARGYSLTTRASDGAPLRDVNDIEVGDQLETRLAKGSVRSTVTETKAKDT